MKQIIYNIFFLFFLVQVAKAQDLYEVCHQVPVEGTEFVQQVDLNVDYHSLVYHVAQHETDYAGLCNLDGNPFPPPTNTGNNATVIIGNLTVDGMPLSVGSEVAVFINPADTSEGTAGLFTYEVFNDRPVFAVWGDDELVTPEKDGLDTGDSLLFWIYDASTDIIYEPGFIETLVYNSDCQLCNDTGRYLAGSIYYITQLNLSTDLPLILEDRVVENSEVPTVYSLSNAYPNPFNPSTSFELTLAIGQNVRVEVYNLLGQRVEIMNLGRLEGEKQYTVRFEADNLATGMYVVRFVGDKFTSSRVVNLIK